MIPPHSPLLLCPRERHPKFCLKWKIKLGRRHANDRIALVVQFDLLSKDILAPGKPFWGRRCPPRHEPPRISKRQRPEQHSIHHAEDRGIRADAESEREDGDGGEARILAQYAQAVAKIHEEVFDGWPAPDGAAVLFN